MYYSEFKFFFCCLLICNLIYPAIYVDTVAPWTAAVRLPYLIHFFSSPQSTREITFEITLAKTAEYAAKVA